MKAVAKNAKAKAVKFIDDEVSPTRPMLQPYHFVLYTFFPTFLYAYIFRLNIGWMRYYHPSWAFVATVVLPVLVLAAYTHMLWKKIRAGFSVRRYKISLAVLYWIVIPSAWLTAEKAYYRFAKSSFDFDSMASYINIDPSKDRGQTYMDAGQVYFKEGTTVEASKAIAFQEDQIYCVAPIVQENMDSGADGSAKSLTKSALKMPASGTVDFWAVGLNCCDPSGLNFKCGESKNPLARAGIRVLREDTRPFFLMAVQEWTAWLQLPSKHPLFFHWVQDPLAQVEAMWFSAMKMFYVNTIYCLVLGLLGCIMVHLLIFYTGF